jgi:hypothetical protein
VTVLRCSWPTPFTLPDPGRTRMLTPGGTPRRSTHTPTPAAGTPHGLNSMIALPTTLAIRAKGPGRRRTRSGQPRGVFAESPDPDVAWIVRENSKCGSGGRQELPHGCSSPPQCRAVDAQGGVSDDTDEQEAGHDPDTRDRRPGRREGAPGAASPVDRCRGTSRRPLSAPAACASFASARNCVEAPAFAAGRWSPEHHS